jgi:histidinol-phosphatase (PHP family)
MLVDTHSHTNFSFDGQQTSRELIEAARRAGLDGICVTDHYEKDIFSGEGKESTFPPDDYFREMLPLRREHQDAPFFLVGVELSYLPHLHDFYRDFVRQYPFDAVIMSLHVVDSVDPYYDPSFFNADKKKAYGHALNLMLEMIRTCPDFDIVGHFDYFSRYVSGQDRKMTLNLLGDEIDALFRAIIETGKALEINTRTVTKMQAAGFTGADAWPDPAIIRRYLELGGTLITLGSDAHKNSEPGSLLPEAAAWLESLGCRWLSHFKNRQAVVTPI